MKCCKKCGIVKPLDEFQRHSSTLDFKQNSCKECRNAAARAYRALPGVKNHRLALQREYRKTPENKTKLLEVSRSTAGLARRAVRLALESGKLYREPCSCCGTNEKVQAHHPDHSQPLNIIWLCQTCHRNIHAMEKRDEHHRS